MQATMLKILLLHLIWKKKKKKKNPVCVVFTWSSLAINTQSKTDYHRNEAFLPLPSEHKISVSRAEDATANTVVHH